MEIVKRIHLLDGSDHHSQQSAERHLTNILCSGVCHEVFHKIANTHRTIDIRVYFVENQDKIEQTMEIIRELKQVIELSKHF